MPASILEITSVGVNQGEAMLNRWHFVNAAGSEDVTGIMAAFVTNVLDPYAGIVNATVSWSELLYRIITNPLAPQQVFPITPPLGSTSSGLPAPSFECFTIRWALGLSVVLAAEVPQRRVRRGSKHIGGLVETWSSGNVIDPSKVTFVESIAEGYLGMSDGAFIPCVCGFPKRPRHVPGTPSVPAAPPNKYALITGFSVNNRVGSEVSRKAGHGS